MGTIHHRVIAMGCYTKFSEEGLAINRFLTAGEISYPYSRISAIRSVRRFNASIGDIKGRLYFAIIFDDGERWTTAEGLRDLDPERDRRLIEYVSGRCGKRPQEEFYIE